MSIAQQLRYAARALVRDNPWHERLVRRLSQHDRWPRETLDAYVDRQLADTLNAARLVLPAFADLDPVRLEEARKVLANLPIIDKPDLLDPAGGYRPASPRRPWQPLGMTSGTTGTPLVVRRDLQSVWMEHAFVHRHFAWGGWRRGMKRAVLRGDLPVSIDRTSPPFWATNRANNQLVLSSRHLAGDQLLAMADEIERFAPAILQAYPSTADALATALERAGRTISIPLVFTSSEPLLPIQRERIEHRLGARLYDMYGMAERTAFATECEHGELHLNEDYSFVELVDEQGRPAEGEGFVVGTTFHNHAQPLVRYRLSDRTRLLDGPCACGRVFRRIAPVAGKYEDGIFGGDGRPVSPSILTFAFKGVEGIAQAQVAQTSREVWEVRIVPGPGWGEAARDKLSRNILNLVDGSIRLDFVIRDQIARTKAGKFRWVVNEMDKH